MDLEIREATVEDAPGIVQVFNPIIEAGIYTVIDTPLTVEDERSYIGDYPARGIFHIAVRESDQKIVGFQSMEPIDEHTRAFHHVGTIGTFVDLAHRRQGIASHLFVAMFEAARRKEYEKIFTYVRADNVAALATYMRQGFSIIGTARRHARVNGQYVDEVLIERFL